MMGIVRGGERTEAEFAELLSLAGFGLERVSATHSMLSVLVARPV